MSLIDMARVSMAAAQLTAMAEKMAGEDSLDLICMVMGYMEETQEYGFRASPYKHPEDEAAVRADLEALKEKGRQMARLASQIHDRMGLGGAIMDGLEGTAPPTAPKLDPKEAYEAIRRAANAVVPIDPDDDRAVEELFARRHEQTPKPTKVAEPKRKKHKLRRKKRLKATVATTLEEEGFYEARDKMRDPEVLKRAAGVFEQTMAEALQDKNELRRVWTPDEDE